MARSVRDYATSDRIDWEHDFVWVQNTSLLKVLDRTQDAVEVMRHDGTTARLSRAEAEAGYFPIRQGRYLKPCYAPCRAHVLPVDECLDGDDGAGLYPAGSAILKQNDSFAAVHRDELMRDYEAVSDPSDSRFPQLPFSR